MQLNEIVKGAFNHVTISKTHLSWWTVFALLLLLTIVIAKAFLLEDAFIVFRSIQNLDQGFYFSAIADVRSQSFTSNLWTLLLVIASTIPGISFQNSAILMSLVITLIAVCVLVQFFIKRQRGDLGLLAIILLIFSNTFTDYSTGGLENPLAHLILIGFLTTMMSSSYKKIDFLILSALAGLLITNRYDQGLIIAPALIITFIVRINWGPDIKALLLGFLPLYMWCMFSWFYYGSIFPDTYHAKINTGVPVLDRIHLAVFHDLRMLDSDLGSMILILFVLIFGLILFIKEIRYFKKNYNVFLHNTAQFVAQHENTIKILSIIAGILLYNIYFFYAGGDYMRGRFMSVVIVAVVFVVVLISEFKLLTSLFYRNFIISLFIINIIILFMPPIFVHGNKYNKHNIVKALTFDIRLFEQNWYFIRQDHKAKDWRALSYSRALEADKVKYPYIVEDISGGIIPFYAGPKYYLIDTLGLSDPLLSRLPCSSFKAAAHCFRLVPTGYKEFIATGDLKKMDPDLARYVDVLFKIKTLPLFNFERIKLLINFSLGKFDKFKQKYVERHSKEYYKPHDADGMMRSVYNETFLKSIFEFKDDNFKHFWY